MTEGSNALGRKRIRATDETNGVTTKHLPTTRNGVNGHNGVQTPCESSVHENKNDLLSLYATSAEAKIWGVATKGLRQPSPPTLLPEYTKPGGVDYIYRELDFWTSGFFPGSLYLLLERRRRYAHVLSPSSSLTSPGFPNVLSLE